MCKLFNFSGKAKRGFTLIELLVVISIIALLISILLPSLQVAKAQAQQVVCAASMRQLGDAALMFAHDNDDWLPMTDGTSLASVDAYDGCTECKSWGSKFPQRSYWYVDIAPYLSLKDHKYIIKADENFGGWFACEKSGIDAPKVFVCPSRKRSIHGVKSLSYGWNWNGVGYKCKVGFVNPAKRDGVGYWGPRKVATIKSACITGMIGENSLGVDPVLEEFSPRHYWGGEVWEGSVPDSSNEFFHFGDRHRGGSSYVCIDGHIEYRKYDEYVEDYVYYRYENREKGGNIIWPNPRLW